MANKPNQITQMMERLAVAEPVQTDLPVDMPYAPKIKLDVLLVAREATHGSFAETARIAQALKTTIVQCPTYENLNVSHREALDMIATKLGRIMSGDPNFKDHWDDIAGYAKLGAESTR
jgi:hypothetical protein